MTEIEKLRILLPHLIEHNEEHAREFLRWTSVLEEAGMPDAAAALKKAAFSSGDVTKHLKTAMNLAGGPISGHEIGRHHHHHHEHE
ncbi:MAG: hypothetical protein ACP5J5_00630 [Dissulfurimicrobium sp.]|uniref:hypothetical protein n=1 Tax=Dissulfurimicrobium TaxID=1769732 RepID=UPI001EDA7A1F|nr:hypothetical protein [Dissulfurimicrobium hydrothermale]UKL14478.1 hypothetical protein LGS26_04410 [Dissulfurimicrobium hydrothermale]